MRLHFEDSFIRALPADPVSGNRVRQVPGAAYSRVDPTPVTAPRLGAVSREVASSLGLTEEDWRDPAFAEVFAGNRLLPGMSPYAACYGGHQFGSWAGQLGDGRAITLGEVLEPRRAALGAAAQGGRADALLAHAPTDGRCCARRCASSCAARPCTTWACRPPAR